jgi:Carboxypeptidase regulatory-like domain/Family of unknown function (DUF6152)
MSNLRLNLQHVLVGALMSIAVSTSVIVNGSSLLFSARTAQSMSSGRITGFVRRGPNEPVPAAIVIISGRESRIRRATRANAQGNFAFSWLPAGSYLMQACSGQFGLSISATVELKAGMNASQDLPVSNDLPNGVSDFSCEESALDPLGTPGPHEYTGAPLSFDLKGDAKDFFRSIARISGLEVDVEPSANRTLPVHLKGIPWDLALDAVLRTSGLGSAGDGKVMHIAAANPSLGQDRILMGTVSIVGTVAEVHFETPPVQLKTLAPDADGQMQVWLVEWESADSLKEIGIRPDTLKSGDRLIITGNLTRTNTLALISVQRPSDGFSWGDLGAVRTAISDGMMFVGPAR